MSDIMGKLSGFLSGVKKRAGEVMESQEILLARGKTASRDVVTDSGEPIVEAGHVISDAHIEQARAAGKLGALAAAAVSSQAQDLRQRARNAYNATDEGIEAHSMASSDQYIEARRYIGWVASVDVADLTGRIIVPAGIKILDEHVREARQADQLGSLIYSAQQSGPPYARAAPPPPAGTPIAPTPSPAKRAARPLGEYYDEEK